MPSSPETICAEAPHASPPPPGVVIAYEPASSGRYIGSPSLAALPDGSYAASHDLFGPGTNNDHTRVYRSEDRGESWRRVAEIPNQWWSTLFVQGGDLYLIGVSREYGRVHIRRSRDSGETWTQPTDERSGALFSDRKFHCAPMPVLAHNGRYWRAMEEVVGDEGWPHHFRAFMMSAPIGSDLLDAGNWVTSNAILRDRSHLSGTFEGWLEGNAVATPDGRILDILRVHTPTSQQRAAVIEISADGTRASFDPETGFIDFPGGHTKFAIRHDPVSRLYWSLSNDTTTYPGSVRNTLALISSADLKQWTIRSIVLRHPEPRFHAFQYVDWLFEGDSLIVLSRTAYDDDHGGAHTFHDANYLTFHRVPRFRDRTMKDPQ